MELMESGLPLEEQTMQPDAVPELEPGGGPEMPESVEMAETPPAEPPKRRRTTRKKAEDTASVPADAPEAGEELQEPENGQENLSEGDHLDPEPGTAEDIVVMGLAEQAETSADDTPAEAPVSEETSASSAPPPDTPKPERTRPTAPRPRAGRSVNNHSRLLSLDLNELDRDLTEQERQEWNNIYASFRSKSVLTGKIIGIEAHAFNVQNRETGQVERQRIYYLREKY